MKGVILTAGAATRLRPITKVTGKVLVPIYNKPMIYYGLSLMFSCGITDIALVCNSFDLPFYKNLFDKKLADCGINIKYFVQKQALGTANALKYASSFVGNEDFVLLFGDNVFVMNGMDKMLKDAIKHNSGLTVFAKTVSDPERFGVIEHDSKFNITNMEEKPKQPKSNLASTGLYVYSGDAMERVKKVKKSPRGEYELTNVLNSYVSEHRAKVKVLDNNCAWLDTGTFDSLLECSKIVKDFENENGLIGCIELELLKAKLINKTEFENLISDYSADYKQRIYNSLKTKK